MKILPKSKKAIPPPPAVTELITKLVNATSEELVQILKDADSWRWARSDLNAWIKVLNRFDDIMDNIIQEYNVEKLQLKPFSSDTKELLSEILRFERLLLENSTNRKTFSSYDRLNSLLSTSDLDILILALNLLLRPSQQYSAQPAVSHALSISTTRLQSLARRWPHLREHSIGLVDVAADKGPDDSEIFPAEAREVNFNFYRTDTVKGAERDKTQSDTVETPTTSPRKHQPISTASLQSSTAVQVHLDEQTIIATPVMNVLSNAIENHSIPDSETFELLCRIRTASSLAPGKKAEREKLVVVRLLAIAIYGHTHSESQATSALFLYEPDLISHIAELLQVDHTIPTIVQTSAIAALDALARYKNKIQEVLTAVNAGVNHGILMALVRGMVLDMSNPDSKLPHAFIESLISFITYIASHASGGNMVVGAGLIPLLIQIIENRSPRRLQAVSKTMQLVDNILYSFTNAFSLFCASRGVEVIVERIEYEVELDIAEYAVDYQPCSLVGSGELPVQRIAILKHILRSMHRMMQSSGTAEGLRGLIDMSLLKSIKKIMEYRGLFGPNILPLAINIMSTFVHNEPTSLSIIQEVGLPETLYNAIDLGIESSIEVIQSIPNAIGALCLNETGQAQLKKRPSIIPAIFSIFTSERHLKVLIDKENAVIIGTAVDELIRHHPSLKRDVFDSLQSTLSRIESLGLAYIPPADIKRWYQLTPTSPPSLSDEDVVMQDEGVAHPQESHPVLQPETVDDDAEEDGGKTHDNYVVSYIDAIGRFLEGFFQHPPHCKDFVTMTDGLQRIGRLTGLPCLPYDFANSVASDSMVQVLRTMTEVATNEALSHLSELVKTSLDETRFFWGSIDETSKLFPFVELSAETNEATNQKFRSLVILHIRVTLLSDVFATAGQSQGRAAIGLLQTLMNNMSLQVLNDMGALHRASIWENIVLNAGLSSKGIETDLASGSTPLVESPAQATLDLPSTEIPISANGQSSTNVAQDNTPTGPAGSTKEEGPCDWNAAGLRQLTQGLPNALAPFFQAMVKMFHSRRNPDPTQKKEIAKSSKVVADIMLLHLGLKDFADKASLYNYYNLIFGLYALLLIDERTSTNTLHTVELYAFYQRSGFNVMFEVCNSVLVRIDEIFRLNEEDRSSIERKELINAFGAIKSALHLIHPIVSSKPLFESGQTLLIITRDKAETDIDYFEPHNFLVKLRTAALPIIGNLWKASWLAQAPIAVSRNVVRSVLEIANGENEENKSDPLADIGISTTTANVPRSGPDEARIRMLTDMGFPRLAATNALIRTHNNVGSATEYLLAQPFLQPDPVPPAEPMPSGDNEVLPPSEPEAPAGDSHAEITPPIMAITDLSPDAPSEEENIPSIDVPAVPEKTIEEWRKELDVARESLKASISRQSLLLIDEHLSLLFDLHIAFTKPSSHQKRAVRDLVDDVKDFTCAAFDIQEQPLANRCRLLALVLCERPASLDQELREELIHYLLDLLSSNVDPRHPPKWLAAHLLVTEALFTLADEPRSITLPKEDEPVVIGPISVGPSRAEAQATVFDFCLLLLAVDTLPADELLSVLRLFVLLTRDREMANQFVKRDGLNMLFRRIRASAVSGGSSYIAAILRHIVEDASVVQAIMQQSIKRYFNQPRTRLIDVNTYVRNCSAIALRDIQSFIDTTKSLCQLEQPFSSVPHIKLQVPIITAEQEHHSDVEPASDMQVDSPAHTLDMPQKSAESVIHLLLSELMNTAKVVSEATPVGSGDLQTSPTSASIDQIQVNASGSSADELGSVSSPVDINDKNQYLCFLMQCLTELLFSYDACKVAFLTYSTKKRPQQLQAKESTNKFRTVTLHFLLSELVTYGTTNPSSDSKQRSKGLLCSWAMNVIGALCVDSSAGQENKEVSSDLAFVRKFVLETISRSIKELTQSSENIEARYGRLLALADLCHRLLTVRVQPTSRKPQDDVPSHLAKIMLEKNFVALLTTSLAEVDLNYPNVRNLVAAILRPLELLTKFAIKMSKSSNKGKGDTQKDISIISESEDEGEAVADTAREETPDLYRNSALGMYSGEMDDTHYSDDEGMEEEEDDEDVEMDYGEETGSEDTSASESDEEDDMGHVTQDSVESWDDGDEEDEEDLVANEDAEEEEDGNDDEREDDEGDDDEDEEGMMWEDIQEDAGDMGLALESIDDETAQGVPIQINHEEDEPDMASDEEEYVVEHGHFHNEGIFSFGDFLDAGLRDGAPGLFFHRRNRSNDPQPFGRSRNSGTAPEATTHPLLLDMSANRTNTVPGRGLRGQRLLGGPPSLLQTIDEMFGEGSLQMLQQIISHDGGGPETFRIEVPAGTILHHSRRFLGHSGRPERVPRPQSHKHGREFDPLLTLQRWAEEMKILHGDFVTERVNKLANHVALAMLPAALEEIRNVKLREDESKRKEEASKSEEGSKPDGKDSSTSADGSSLTESEVLIPSGDTPSAADLSLSGDVSQPVSSTSPEQNSSDMQMTDASLRDADTEMVDASQMAPAGSPSVVQEVTDNGTDNATAEVSAGSASSPPERITVMIHGSAVDITDTGIDPTFLEALPDDMREEVLNQHVRDQQAARVERPPDSQISSEFLDALPPEIRAEIIQQEAMERARLRSEEAARGPTREATEIDPASFIASLDPTLRQAVLLDQDDGFIQSLPSHMIAEAGSYRDEAHTGGPLSNRIPIRTIPTTASPRKYSAQHDAIFLLDRPNVAVLVRLLFFPQVLKKTLLFKVLVNLCENAKTRVELFNILLSILQDGTADLMSVDKSFSQMTVRSRDTKPTTPKAVGKQKGSNDYFSTLSLPVQQMDVVPDLITQRCLEALTYIVSTNEMSSLFFLTEHELPVGLRKASTKKGKGKEKQASHIHYPIILLMNLLDRQSLLKTPAILESVVCLLATVTRPLTTLKDKYGRSDGPPSAPASLLAGAIHVQNAATSSSNIGGQATLEIDNSSASQPDVPATTSQVEAKDSTKVEVSEERLLLPHPPQVPNSTLRLIVNILTIGECSGRTFTQSLTLIQNLSNIPDARDVIAHELKAKAQEFGQTLITDLDELAIALQQKSESSVMVSSVAAKFSPSSSTQAKLLRVLKTIDYMYSPKASNVPLTSASDDIEKVQVIYESFQFTPLWRKLGDCLSIIGEDPEMAHVATVLLPLIESLMVVCKFVGSKSQISIPRALRASASPRSPTTPRESMEDLFISFTDVHRKILNQMVRNNPSLMSGSFSLLVNNSRVLDFDNKRNYFNQQLHRKPHMREHYGTLQLNVRRARVFEDSFSYLQRKTGDQIKHGKLSVRFYEEEGVDAGGLTREWFQILARQMFNPNNALFQPCAADKQTYQPNKNSWVNPEHLSFFKFVGRVIGKAIYDGRLLDAYFARSLYRQLLGKPVDYKDVEWVDPEYYNSLCWILENDPTPLELTFSVEADEFGVNRIVPLKTEGETIAVTQENKREFVQLSAQYRLYSSIKDQIENLSSGFYEIIPKDLITIFNEQELELLISGTPDIDVDEWRSATEYNGYTSSDPNIVWWWRALKSFNREERAKVLSFATGTSRVPLSGFVDLQGVQGVQKFSIHRAYGEPDRLPQAHTCFNQIDLPQYTSYEMLRQQLLMAIHEGGEGFAFS